MMSKEKYFVYVGCDCKIHGEIRKHAAADDGKD